MSHNKISKFELGWTINWLGLKLLDLSYNNFSGNLPSFSLNFVKHNPLKFKLDLRNNFIDKIEILSDRILAHSNKVAMGIKVDVENNPIKCDCASYFFSSGQNKRYKSVQQINLVGINCTRDQGVDYS